MLIQNHARKRPVDRGILRCYPRSPSGKSIIYYDASCAYFGLRVTEDGAKSFTLDYRVGRLQRRHTIGTYRDPWRVAAARRRAFDGDKRLVDLVKFRKTWRKRPVELGVRATARGTRKRDRDRAGARSHRSRHSCISHK